MEENILREGNKITYYNDKVNAKLMQISDIHYTDGFNTKKFNVIEEQLGIENPDYLLVCGDIFDASEGINIEGLMKWLESVNNYVRIVFSLLMCHSPYSINMIKHFKENSYFKDIDLILSGHMHGGLVHPLMRPFISEPLGIIAPNKDILPNFTRGITYIDGIPNIISEGVTKLAGMNFVDNMYPVDVKTIKLVRKNS